MTSHNSVVLLLLAFGLLSGLASAAFNASDYFYPDETDVSVEYTNFTLDGTPYAIVAFDGDNAFLLEDGQIVSNQSRTDSLLHAYYKDIYYPTGDELESLEALALKFNASRNDGYDYKNKEEYVCRDDVLMSNGKIKISGVPVTCRDNESCSKNALLLFGIYGEGLNLGSATAILGPLMNFTPYSFEMDEILANITVRLDNVSENNVVDTIKYIRDQAPVLKNDSLKIESTVFRTPRLNDSADRKACQMKCWAICPSMELDQDSLDQLKDEADTLYDKVSPLNKYLDVSTEIGTNTAARMEGHRIENLTAQYFVDFEPVNESGRAAIAYGTETLTHVRNTTLSRKLDSLVSLHATIPQDIEAHNFSTVDADIVAYKSLIKEVENISAGLIEVYNRTHQAKNTAHAMIFLIESKDLDPVTMKALDLIKNETADLDASFQEGLTTSQLADLEVKYGDITLRAKALFSGGQELPATKAMSLFRGFARRVNTGIANAVTQLNIMSRQDVPKSALPLGAFSALVFLSLSAVAFLFFLSLFSLFRFPVPKTAHILVAAFLCVVVLLLGFSGFLYLLLGKTSTDATLPEFMADMNSKNESAILVDTRAASLTDAPLMRSCGFEIADAIAAKNKSWTVYYVDPGQCTITGSSGINSSSSVDDCVARINRVDSAFVLSYSQANEVPKFAIVYQNRADISGNIDYYDSCPLATLFS